MLFKLSKDSNNLSIGNFTKIMDFFKSDGTSESIPFILEDDEGLQNNPNLETYIKEIRDVDPNGFFPILLNHTCDHYIDDAWVESLYNMYSTYNNINIGIILNTNSNIDNIRKLLKHFSLARSTQFKFIIDSEEFDLARCMNIMVEYTANNYLVLSLDHTKKVDYVTIANKLMSFNEKRKKHLIALKFECGFPLCMFNDEQIGQLVKSPLAGFNFFCIPEVVVEPNLDAKYCRLSSAIINIYNTTSYKDLIEQLTVVNEEEAKPDFKPCSTCWNNNKLCSGGCPLSANR